MAWTNGRKRQLNGAAKSWLEIDEQLKRTLNDARSIVIGAKEKFPIEEYPAYGGSLFVVGERLDDAIFAVGGLEQIVAEE